jgi:mersacidin/lichenicidin family type 2 lantibiotic
MTKNDIIRAWKNPEYRESLSAEQRALVPEHPAGLVELSDSDIDDASGGIWTTGLITWIPKSISEGTCALTCQMTKLNRCPVVKR